MHLTGAELSPLYYVVKTHKKCLPRMELLMNHHRENNPIQ